jgi:hypothetical protein
MPEKKKVQYQLQPDGTVNVKKNGEYFSLPEEDAFKAIGQGIVEAVSDEEAYRYDYTKRLEEEASESPIRSALEGAARSITMGASDWVLGNTIYDTKEERDAALARSETLAGGIGEIGGMFVPTGVAGLAGKGIKSINATSKAARAARAAAGFAAEGTIASAGQEIAKEAYGAEGSLGNVATGAGLSAAVGGTMATIGKLTKYGLDKATKSVVTKKEVLAKGTGKRYGTSTKELQKILDKDGEAALRKRLEDLEKANIARGKPAVNVYTPADVVEKETAEFAQEMASSFSQMASKAKLAAKNAFKSPKMSAVEFRPAGQRGLPYNKNVHVDWSLQAKGEAAKSFKAAIDVDKALPPWAALAGGFYYGGLPGIAAGFVARKLAKVGIDKLAGMTIKESTINAIAKTYSLASQGAAWATAVLAAPKAIDSNNLKETRAWLDLQDNTDPNVAAMKFADSIGNLENAIHYSFSPNKVINDFANPDNINKKNLDVLSVVQPEIYQDLKEYANSINVEGITGKKLDKLNLIRSHVITSDYTPALTNPKSASDIAKIMNITKAMDTMFTPSVMENIEILKARNKIKKTLEQLPPNVKDQLMGMSQTYAAGEEPDVYQVQSLDEAAFTSSGIKNASSMAKQMSQLRIGPSQKKLTGLGFLNAFSSGAEPSQQGKIAEGLAKQIISNKDSRLKSLDVKPLLKSQKIKLPNDFKEIVNGIDPDVIAGYAQGAATIADPNEVENPSELGNKAADQLGLLKEYSVKVRDKKRFNEIAQSILDPRTILSRLDNNSSTMDDVVIFNQLFPIAARQITFSVNELLDEHFSNIANGKKSLFTRKVKNNLAIWSPLGNRPQQQSPMGAPPAQQQPTADVDKTVARSEMPNMNETPIERASKNIS